ncbi:MAG: ornithine cyclodeaminase family protein [Kiloniellaceae bacterium]
MDEVIAGLEKALETFTPNIDRIPIREGFSYDVPSDGLLEWMPAMTLGGHATMKIVGYHPRNPSVHQLPTILSTALTFDTDTGQLLGICDATILTAMRTGAASAVATRRLAAPSTTILGLIGCGAQAVTQLHALNRVMDFERVLVYDIDASARESFAARTAMFSPSGLSIEATPVEHLVSTADIICTATSVGLGKGPVFSDVGLKGHVHVNAVGSDFPGKTELPPSLLKRALVCPDFADQAVREGECQQLQGEDIGPDLATLVKDADRFAFSRERETVFDSTGWALQDHVATEIFFRFARELDRGELIDIEIASDDPRNPYDFIGARAGFRRDTAPRPRADGNFQVSAASALARAAE